MTAPQDDRTSRAALSRLLEPGDGLGMLAVTCWGAPRALAVLTGADTPDASERHDLAVCAADNGHRLTSTAWSGALERWSARARRLTPERDLAAIERLGGRLIIPSDATWPTALFDLGVQMPVALWSRGQGSLAIVSERVVAIVGSREATSYGQEVTRQLSTTLCARGVTVLSGGAYGIDAAAHRAALSVSEEVAPVPSTVAVLAGGLDRFYPAGNEDMLREITERGVLVSEMPPGASPTRYRFLARNRLIAALAKVVVIVEARWRSGAQNTAGHAFELGRDVGVVPGPVTSPSSAGCHRLLRESPATLVTDADEVLALLPATGEPAQRADSRRASESPTARPHDHLTVEELLVYEALPLRSAAPVDRICTVAGLGTGTVLGVLQRLRHHRLAEQSGVDWRRASAVS